MDIRYSKQRQAILDVLNKKDYHPTVDDIFSIVRKRLPKISLATVYRNIEQLCRMGKIRKLDTGTEPGRYDGNLEKHSHIKCTRCGVVRDVWLEEKLKDFVDFGEAIPGFHSIGYRIEFFGTCKRCQPVNTL